MLKRRIACILLIISALIMYIFDNGTVTLALLVALVVMPAVSLGMLALSGKGLRITLEKDMQGAEAPKVRIGIENPDFVPLASIEAELSCENLRTGEVDSCVINDTPRPKGNKDVEFEVMPKNAGRYRISVSNAEITDPLMLSRRSIKCEDSEYLTIMPEIFDMQLSYTSDAAMLEADRSADSRSGNDPGEVRAIREYVAGDPVRNIHWKLSEKMDKLLVRELGNPITDRFLIILDTCHEIRQDPAALEAAASVFASLAMTLRKNASGLSLGWTDPETGRAVIRPITEDADLEKAADEYLAMPASMYSAFSKIERDLAESRYAHIVIVGTRVPDGIEAIANGCQVTVLLHGETGTATEANVTTIGFGTNTYKTDLAGIEI